jgi:hypothetical protein
MAKTKITEYSTTAGSNTDVGNIQIEGSNDVANFDNALRELMKHIADLNTGASFIHDTYKIADSDAETKLAKFDAGSITAGQTRTFTFPDVSGTFALTSNVGLIDSSDDGSKNTAFNIPSGTTAQRPATPDGVQMRYNTTISAWEGYNGSSWAGIGEVLDEDDFASDSATKAPSQQSTKAYVDAASSMVLLETQEASNDASLDFTIGFSSDYSTYKLVVIGALPSTDGSGLSVLLSSDGGSTWLSTGVDFLRLSAASTSTSVSNTTHSDIRLTYAIGNVNAQETGASGTVDFYRFNDAEYTTALGQIALRTDSNAQTLFSTNNLHKSATAMNGVQVKMTSGNIASGTFKLYGVK